MIHHCVWIRFRPDVSREQRIGLFTEIQSLVGVVPGMLQVLHNHNAPFEERDHGFSDGFIAVFSDATALQAYQDNAHHKVAAKKIEQAALGGVQGIMVFDLESK